MKQKNLEMLKMLIQLNDLIENSAEVEKLSENFSQKLKGGYAYANNGCTNSNCSNTNDGCNNSSCAGAPTGGYSKDKYNSSCSNSACGQS